MTEHKEPGTRAVRQAVTVEAPADAVWRALTDAEELRRWFPVDARVEPGPGGMVWLSWGPGVEGTSRIEVWEPERRLRLVEEWPGAEGKLVRFVLDYHLEARGGSTVLRLVHSGFGESSDWDDQYHSTEDGWRYFLFNLKHYLERHAGVPRALTWERRRLSASRDDVWRALNGGEGLELKDGKVRLPLGDEPHRGTVVMARPSRHLAAQFPSLDDAVLFVELESGKEDWHCGTYLSTYGLAPDRLTRLRTDFQDFLDRILSPFQAPPG